MSKMAPIKTRLQNLLLEFRNFNWNDLSDFNTSGAWPAPVKVLIGVLLFAACLGAGYWFHIKSLQAGLLRVANEETGLRSDLESKAVLAANLDAYRRQMMEMEETFGNLLSQLPGQTEVPGLLEDITFTGLGSGLEFTNINLESEIAQEFYIELPITIQVTGGYHDFGSFVSGVASLSRIVTLHDFAISAPDNRGELSMRIAARTYRYNAGDETAPPNTRAPAR
jgi:type IV pilus assembly protein PilO